MVDLKWYDWVKILLALIAVLGVVSLYNGYRISKVLEEQGREIADNLQKTNALLETYEHLPTEINEIKINIAKIESKTNKLIIEVNETQRIETDLNKSIERLNRISDDLNALQSKYPPVESQNIVFQNMSKEEANILIQNAINQRSLNIVLTFAFGSLIGFSLCLIFKYINKK